MEWTDEMVRALRVMWDGGLPTEEIGRRLGVSKNAAIGKAHRLHLPGRPSPINLTPQLLASRAEKQRQAAARKFAGAEEVARARRATSVIKEARVKAKAPPPMPRPPRPQLDDLRLSTTETCQWPTSHAKPWTFCGEAAVVGNPYCQHHRAVASARSVAPEDEAA